MFDQRPGVRQHRVVAVTVTELAVGLLKKHNLELARWPESVVRKLDVSQFKETCV